MNKLTKNVENLSPIKPWKVWSWAGGDVLSAVFQIPGWLKLSHEIQSGSRVADDFIGINISTSDDPQCDDEVIHHLDGLGLRHVRLDYSYCAPQGNGQRLLNRVLEHGCDVMLDLFPSPEQAESLRDDQQAQKRWGDFLVEVFTEYADKVSVFEIGSTPNRGKWSGFEGVSYLKAWQIATHVAANFNVTLAGPNISDFEPLYNYSYLKAMGRVGPVPAIHTDNLFVERVIQPEAYDHRVAGKAATKKLNLNLVKKARIIDLVGKKEGCVKTFCTYTCWTRKRLGRWTSDPEQKNASYLTRYLMIAAASGALDRVYWGPLICNRDGLVDCGDTSYPQVDNVSFYKEVRGEVASFKVTKAYHAFKFIVSLLRGVSCQQGMTADNGLNHFVFHKDDGSCFHAVWCLDGYSMPLSALYNQDVLADVEVRSVYGELLSEVPQDIGEQPIILSWQQPPEVMTVEQLGQLSNVMKIEVQEDKPSELQQVKVDNRFWRGMVALPQQVDIEEAVNQFMPSSLLAAKELAVLRDTRNRLWNISLDNNEHIQTVKLNRAKGIKRFTYRFLDSKGKRHWDNATEMLRRGVNTPQPLAYFEQPDNSGIKDNYYVCQFIPNAFSARDVFTAFKSGELNYRGITKDDMFDLMASFIAKMHNQNIVHKDLSSGNLMMTLEGDNLVFYAIDIGRATIDKASEITVNQRFTDLKRICYKLCWSDRELFVEAYNRHIDEPLPNSWRWAAKSYDWKQRSKKAIKAKLKGVKR